MKKLKDLFLSFFKKLYITLCLILKHKFENIKDIIPLRTLWITYILHFNNSNIITFIFNSSSCIKCLLKIFSGHPFNSFLWYKALNGYEFHNYCLQILLDSIIYGSCTHNLRQKPNILYLLILDSEHR